MADSTEKTFGIFVNSNQSIFLSTEKSYANIPFQGNLIDHDPNKTLQIALTSMLFTNTIYNITTENNRMNILIYWAEGRGRSRRLEERAIEIPVGFYNITQLSDYLSKAGIMGEEIIQKLFRYGVIESYVNIFTGFGAVPADPNDPILTKAAPTNDSNTKIVFQSPDLGHMIQFGTDLLTAPDNWGADEEYSYIYEGIFVECPTENSILPQLLKMLGFFNIKSAPAPVIELQVLDNVGTPLPPRRGYGLYFEAFAAKDQGSIPAYDNTVYYKVRDLALNVLPIALPVNFHGVVYQSGVLLTCAYELFDTNHVIELNNGSFINGTGITIPAPYVVNYQDCVFDGTFTNGSSILVVNNIISGQISIGMSVGIQYDVNTGSISNPSDLSLAQLYFDYASGTTPGPGLENDHCYYIEGPGPNPGEWILNQDFVSAFITVTIPNCLGTVYVLTTSQTAMIGGITEAMLSSPVSVTDVAGRVTPNDVTNLAGVDEIHVHCPQLRTRNMASTSFGSLSPSDVIAVVPVEVEFGFKQSYQPPNLLTSYLINTNITNLEITLTNARSQPLNFNGVDWSMTFFCTEVDTLSYPQLLEQGTLNTPFQDQLATMEGTAHAQERSKRARGREITFYDASAKSGGYGRRY